MANSAQSRRRRFGTAFLAGAAGLLILGQTLLKPHLAGLIFIFYWLACFLLTVLTLITALVDVRAVRRQAREQQSHLLRDAIKKMEHDEEGESDV